VYRPDAFVLQPWDRLPDVVREILGGISREEGPHCGAYTLLSAHTGHTNLQCDVSLALTAGHQNCKSTKVTGFCALQTHKYTDKLSNYDVASLC
jgi:hypothetical protein